MANRRVSTETAPLVAANSWPLSPSMPVSAWSQPILSRTPLPASFIRLPTSRASIKLANLTKRVGDLLQVTKLLTDCDRYLTDIASQLELSKPTIKHHLALLRSAGLVTVTEEGGMTYYSLRRARLDDASVELKRFLVT